MIIIKDAAAMERAVNQPIDPNLIGLLLRRRSQLSEYDGCELADLAMFLIVQPGDRLEAIEAETTFPLMVNFVDGKRFGDPAFEPSWEHIWDHGSWYECTYIMSDDGFGTVVFIPEADDIDPLLLKLCRTYAGR